MRKMVVVSLFFFWGLAMAPVCATAQAANSADRMDAASYDARARMASTHPNELWRLYGNDSAARGSWTEALQHYRRGARYADKYSQHRISMIYWQGAGVERDAARAYAWADLAAERQYPVFLLLREKMWLEMSEAERERAQQEGVALYAEFGDRVAKPRFERAVARARGNLTGSRVGATRNQLHAYAPKAGEGPFGGPDTLDLSPALGDARWNADSYWAAEDAIWGEGGVDVGPAEPIGEKRR